MTTNRRVMIRRPTNGAQVSKPDKPAAVVRGSDGRFTRQEPPYTVLHMGREWYSGELPIGAELAKEITDAATPPPPADGEGGSETVEAAPEPATEDTPS